MAGIHGMTDMSLITDMSLLTDMATSAGDIYPNPDSVIIYGESMETRLLEGGNL